MAHAEPHAHHITPFKTLATVFGALVFLTLLTVFTSRLDLGVMNIPLALAIALTKGTLVVAFFMALKYDNKVNALVLTVGTLFVIVFLVFTLFDTVFRGDLSNVSPLPISDQQPTQQVEAEH